MAELTPLHAAVEAGDLTSVQALVEAGANIEEKHGSQYYPPTPLYRAAEKGWLPVARYLVERGAKLEATAREGRTALFAAAARGHTDIVRMLIERGANKHAKDRLNWTPLLCACFDGRLAAAEYLLEQGCDPNPICEDGYNCLHWAALQCQPDVAQLLFRWGADLDVRTGRGELAVDLAKRERHREIVQAIRAEKVRRGGDAEDDEDDDEEEEEEEEWDSEGSQLHEAVGADDLVRVQELVAAGTDIEKRSHFFKDTPLYNAAHEGHVTVARFLVERGANKEATNSHGDTAMHIAAEMGRVEVVRMLMECGANKDAGDVDNRTPLIKAAVRGHAAVAECLLEHGCALDHADVSGLTALHLAAFFNKLEVVQRLLHYGATPDVQDNGGRTPAVEAARRGYHAVADAIRAEMTRRIRRMERLMATFLAFKATFAEGAKQPLLVRLRVECQEIVRHVVAFL